MATCKVCGRSVRKTSVALIKQGSSLKGARVCSDCETKFGVTIVVAHQAPRCKCGKPAIKCGSCATDAERKDKASDFSELVKKLKGLAKVARASAAEEVRGSPEFCIADGRAEGLETTISLLESGRF